MRGRELPDRTQHPFRAPNSAAPLTLSRGPGKQPDGRHEPLRISVVQVVVVHHHGAVAVAQPLLQRRDRRVRVGHLRTEEVPEAVQPAILESPFPFR